MNEEGQFDGGGTGASDVLDWDGGSDSDAIEEAPVAAPEGTTEPWVDPLAPEPVPAQQASPALTLEQWQSVQSASQQQQQQQEPAPAMTPEQVDEMLKVYNPNEALVENLFGDMATPETRLSAFKEMVAGITGHLTTVMGYSSDVLRQDLSGQFSPALDMVTEQKESNFSNLLQEAYPALKGQEAVIRQTVTNLRNQGYMPKDGLEAGRMVAGQVEAQLRTVNPNFSLANQPQAQQQPQSNMPSMAGGMSAGGGGGPAGAGGGTSGNSKKPGWQSVFD